MLETDDFKYNFSNFYILEIRLHIWLKLARFALSKWYVIGLVKVAYGSVELCCKPI